MPNVSINTAIAAVRAEFNIKVRRTGRVKPPNLPDLQLKAIGDKMVAAQKERWAKSINSDGVTAKPLSVRYAIIKGVVKPGKRPKRDMDMTGRTIKNFMLRKAALGNIRAENTTRLERAKARRANKADQMIGLALSDAKVIFDASHAEYGQYVNTAWIPIDGTTRRPKTLNMVP